MNFCPNCNDLIVVDQPEVICPTCGEHYKFEQIKTHYGMIWVRRMGHDQRLR